MHLPFCAHRCGYCDFVTVVGREEQHRRYVDALLAELELERGAARGSDRDRLSRRRHADVHRGRASSSGCWPRCRAAAEVTVEANPETVTPRARAHAAGGRREPGVARGAELPARSPARPRAPARGRNAVRRAFYHLRDANFDNISLDLLHGIPGQSTAALDLDISEALALGPEHLSYYELEAKPGTRFAHAHGAELERQAEAMEDYFDVVVERLIEAGYRWYETANFCLAPEQADGRDLRARHNLAYWLGREYLGPRHRRGLDGRDRAATEHASPRRVPRGARAR